MNVSVGKCGGLGILIANLPEINDYRKKPYQYQG